jgi:hypothetical protein
MIWSRFIRIITTVICFFLASYTYAQDAQVSNERDRDAFLNSVVLKAQIDVCVKRVPALSDELLPAFENWKEQKGEALSRGEAIARAEWSKTPPSFEVRIQRLSNLSARLYEAIAVPDNEISSKCEALLAK